jgi:hypothetical protein
MACDNKPLRSLKAFQSATDPNVAAQPFDGCLADSAGLPGRSPIDVGEIPYLFLTTMAVPGPGWDAGS